MAVLKHIHTYVLWQDYKRRPVLRAGEYQYKCADPGCTHYMTYSMVLGKLSLCGKCRRNEITLTKEMLSGKRVTPVCLECSKSKLGQAHRQAKEIVADVFKSVEFSLD